MSKLRLVQAIGSWFFVMALSFFVVIGSVAVHEIGHGLMGTYAGCEVQNIVLYSHGFNPATNIKCENDFNQVLVALSGMGLNILFGVIFLFANRPIMNNIAYMFFGFGPQLPWYRQMFKRLFPVFYSVHMSRK